MDALLIANPGQNAPLEEALLQRGHQVTRISNGDRAVELQHQQHFPLVFVDVESVTHRANHVLRSLRGESEDGAVVALVDAEHSERLEDALAAGATDWIETPASRRVLVARIEMLERAVALFWEQRDPRNRREVTEKQHSRLLTCEQNFHALLEAAPDPISVHRNEVILYANPAAVSAFRYPSREALIGRSVFDLIHPQDREQVRERIRKVIETGEPAPLMEEQFVCEDGSVRVGEVYSFRIHHDGGTAVMSVGRDLTEPRQLRSLLMHSERLATIGTMTAAIAHELKNPLMYVIVNLADLCRRLPGLSNSVSHDVLEGLEKRVEAALMGAERLQRLSKDLLTFAHARDEQRMPVDLRTVVEGAMRMADPELRDIDVSVDFHDIPLVSGAELRLTQVFLNLLLNAAHALHETEDRPKQVRIQGKTDHEGWAVVEVKDTGKGIARADLKHVFEPFYTTKPVGKGTGLGLSVARTIVSDLGGTISVHSELGVGTSFRVRLPAAQKSES